MSTVSVYKIALRILGANVFRSTVRSNLISKVVNIIPCKGFVKNVHTSNRISFPRVMSESKSMVSSNISNKKMVLDSDPPSSDDVNRLYDFFEKSSRVVVLTGAGMSTECGIPDYRSPNGAYSTGFKPITHQEFLRSQLARRRYWVRSYAGWRRFTASKPGSAHLSLATLENTGRVKFMITQSVDRHHSDIRLSSTFDIAEFECLFLTSVKSNLEHSLAADCIIVLVATR